MLLINDTTRCIRWRSIPPQGKVLSSPCRRRRWPARARLDQAFPEADTPARMQAALNMAPPAKVRAPGMHRRSLRLLCGGWLPHDDGASEVCLVLATDVGGCACPKRIRGFPLPRPAPWPMQAVLSETAADQAACTTFPMDHMKHSSSRATAAVATTVRFPREVSRL